MSDSFLASNSQTISLAHSLFPAWTQGGWQRTWRAEGWKRQSLSIRVGAGAQQEVAGRQRLPTCHNSSPEAKLCS